MNLSSIVSLTAGTGNKRSCIHVMTYQLTAVIILNKILSSSLTK